MPGNYFVNEDVNVFIRGLRYGKCSENFFFGYYTRL